MINLNSKRGSARVASAVIKELGVEVIREESKGSPDDKPISPGAVTFYKKNGFPIFFEKYLRSKYKKLSAWNIDKAENEGDVNG